MSTEPVADPADRSTRIPDPKEPIGLVVLPTLGLFAGGVALWLGSTALALTGTWPLALSVPFNAIASFVLFTVAHDAAHNAVSSNAGRGRCAGSRSTSGTWFF